MTSTETARDDVDALYAALKRYTPAVRQDRRLPVPPARSVEVFSAECGSRLVLDARIEGGRVQAVGYQVRACSLGQASTAMLVERAVGLTQPQLQRVRAQFEALLREGRGHCDWPELEAFAPACDIPNRHGSALLPFEALGQLFDLAQRGARAPDGGDDAR